MDRCEECESKNHGECQGLVQNETWCECPCHTGELADPTVVPEVQDVPSPREPH